MIDNHAYPRSENTSSSPSTKAFSVTPHDSNELSEVAKALYVGGAGDVSVILRDDNTAVTFKAVAAGTILPVRARIVRVTGTTATYIVALAG